VQELLLKVLYAQGARLGQQLADTVCLPFTLVDEQLQTLQQRRLVEVRGTAGTGAAPTSSRSSQGRERAQEALESSQYVGPAPVPLEQYGRWLRAHTMRRRARHARGSLRASATWCSTPQLLELLGPAINSASSLFLYGESGNGKTLMADTIAGTAGREHVRAVRGAGGRADHAGLRPGLPPSIRAAEPRDAGEGASIWRDVDAEHDRRFARVRRPVVVTGGELTLAELDLQYDHSPSCTRRPSR
jgi:hypothetical protein